MNSIISNILRFLILLIVQIVICQHVCLFGYMTPANQNGTVVWEGDDPRVASLEAIPQHSEINIGDSVFTNGFSNIFPKGLFIGTVKSVQVGNNASFLTIKINLATQYADVYTVYLVENLFKSEIDSLKANFKDE